jgi:UDP-glucose 4-epimerase
MQAMVDGVSPVVHGDGRQSRDFTYIDDVVRANLAAAQAPASVCSGKVYNVAGGASYSLLVLLDILGDLLGIAPRPVFAGPRAGDVRHTRADITSALRDLGHTPRVDFPEGLRRTVLSFAGEVARKAV